MFVKKSHFFLTQSRGFTLLEMAIVLIIVGMLAGTGVSLMGMLTERKARNDGLQYLARIKEAVLSYASMNGRFPFADSNADGLEDTGSYTGTIPYQTLALPPTDPQKRLVTYAVARDLTVDRNTSCGYLRGATAPSSPPPRVVDADGSATAFNVAAVIVSAGPRDEDADGNVFDDVTGAFAGDNRDGIPNYIRYPPVEGTFDDITNYIGNYELYGLICGRPVLSIQHNAGPRVWIYNSTEGTDVGFLDAGQTQTYVIVAGSGIEIQDAPNGTGNIIPTTPATPLTVAGEGRIISVP